ncbi:MAG: hypothetical protein QM747_17055 [Nocardioides sp.]
MTTPFGVTLGPGSSAADLTGNWRTERAVYLERVAPCGNACPAGEDVRSWLYDAESGGAGYEAAWRRIMEVNPFPAVMGRVCYHPCETACNRGQLDESVGINSVERFVGDEALRQGWSVTVSGLSPEGASSWWERGLRACRRRTTWHAWDTRSRSARHRSRRAA